MNQLKITFIGHSTALVDMDGCSFITDPIYSDRVRVLKRQKPPGIKPSDLPPLSGVLISHAHYDHLDIPSLALIDPGVPLIMPYGIKNLLKPLGRREIIELRAWESVDLSGVKISAVPVFHNAGRWLVDDFFRRSAGYVIEARNGTVYFAGDTALFKGLKEIGMRFKIDVALLPIGSYKPRFIMKWSHLSPKEALKAFGWVDSKFMIPIHWGSFRLSTEKMSEPLSWLKSLTAESGLNGRVVILNPGDSWVFEKDVTQVSSSNE